MTSSIDSLPDDLICHVLSFLPTDISVQTSILAKRYRFLWTYVPSLYFDSGYHNTGTSFLYMISRVMLLSKAMSIDTFHILSRGDIDSSKFELETWLTTAVERNVQTIFLNFCNCDNLEDYVFPPCIFSCKTLVDLKLCGCTFPSFSSGSINLPSLKLLELDFISYAVDDALPCLLSCCPVLDKLVICSDVRGNFYNISSHSIKSLEVRLYDEECDWDDLDCELKIHTPALKYLLLCCDPVFSNWNKSISNSKFNSLTQLVFEGHCLFLMDLLESAENLEVLIIYKFYEGEEDDEDEEDGEKWVEPKQVPTCVLSHLRTLRLCKYWCGEQMVGYILRNARVLERIEICGWFDSDEAKHKALKRISMFERGSVACKVAFR